MATDEQVLAQMYRDLCTHSINKDADGIRSLLAPEYVLVHMTGVRQGPQSYIDAVLDGTLNYYASEHDAINVSVAADGQTARISGRTRTTAAVYGGGQHTWRLRQELAARKVDGAWKLTESRASTY